MGIQGLIPFLEKASRRVNVADYKGSCVAIDAYCWLHKGTFSCVEKLARGEKCDAYVQYCMKFVNMLLSHNIKPILVFDGRHLPAKAGTEKKRRESREFSRKKAAELLRAGRVDEARNHLRRCIDVTHEMALALMHECRAKNVDCIVAPYEADAQLAYLNINNIAQIVITEDSDLVLFGCSKILFKMDLAGNGLLVERERLCTAMNMRPEQFTFDKFRYMCILSGCDYLPSLPGIGLGKACKFMSRILDDDIHKALVRLPTSLNMRSLTVPESYRDDFMKADAAFRFQLVYDPKKRCLLHLNKPEDDTNVGDYVGKMLPPEIAYQLALGNLDPFTLEKVDNFDPDTDLEEGVVAAQSSIWARDGGYKPPMKLSRPAPMFETHRPSTKGKVAQLTSSSLLPPKKRILEEKQEECNEAELQSLYSTKKPCVDETTDKENSPQKSPGGNCEMTSPVLSSCKKSHQNPFLKQQLLPSSVEAVKTTPGALSKFCRPKRTQIDKSVVVQSRFFSSKGAGDSSKAPTVLDTLDDKPQDNVSLLQSFKWNRELLPAEQDSIPLTSAAKRDFKMPVATNKLPTEVEDGEDKVPMTSPVNRDFKMPVATNKLSTEVVEDGENMVPMTNVALRDFKMPVVTDNILTKGAEDEDSVPLTSDTNRDLGMPDVVEDEADSGMEMTPKDEMQEDCTVRSQSQIKRVNPKTCRRPGLSKGKKQLSLLDMFGCPKKSKLQHV